MTSKKPDEAGQPDALLHVLVADGLLFMDRGRASNAWAFHKFAEMEVVFVEHSNVLKGAATLHVVAMTDFNWSISRTTILQAFLCLAVGQ